MRVHAVRIFANVARGNAFDPQLNTLMSVGILLQYFRGKLFQFERGKTVSNLVMCRFISQTKLCSAASFTRASHYSTLSFTFSKKLDGYI